MSTYPHLSNDTTSQYYMVPAYYHVAPGNYSGGPHAYGPPPAPRLKTIPLPRLPEEDEREQASHISAFVVLVKLTSLVFSTIKS